MKMKQKQTTSVREYFFDIGKIVEGALGSDAEKVLAYSERLRDRLLMDGDKQVAGRIDQIIKQRAARMLSFASVGENSSRIPVDPESRLPVADMEFVESLECSPVLPEDIWNSIQRFIRFVESADELTAQGVGISASLLLYGPPGCGKTMLAKHIANSLKLPLITARTDSLISSYLGSTAKNLRLLFEHAMSRPCILFLDEFDALGKMRDDSHELGELKRVVISLLQNIDAMGPDHILLAATNHEHLLDRAIWRRFTCKLKLDLPSVDDRQKLIAQFLHGFTDEETSSLLAVITEGLSGAELRELCNDALRVAILDKQKTINEQSFLESTMRYQSSADSWVSKTTSEKISQLFDYNINLTQKQLGRLIGVAQPTISKVLKKEIKNAKRPVPAN